MSERNCGDKGRMDHNNDHFGGFPFATSDGGEVRTGLSDECFRRECSTPIKNGVSRDVSSFMSDRYWGDKGRTDHNNCHCGGFAWATSDCGEVRNGISDDRLRREFSTPIKNVVSRDVSSFMSDRYWSDNCL